MEKNRVLTHSLTQPGTETIKLRNAFGGNNPILPFWATAVSEADPTPNPH